MAGSGSASVAAGSGSVAGSGLAAVAAGSGSVAGSGSAEFGGGTTAILPIGSKFAATSSGVTGAAVPPRSPSKTYNVPMIKSMATPLTIKLPMSAEASGPSQDVALLKVNSSYLLRF